MMNRGEDTEDKCKKKKSLRCEGREKVYKSLKACFKIIPVITVIESAQWNGIN